MEAGNVSVYDGKPASVKSRERHTPEEVKITKEQVLSGFFPKNEGMEGINLRAALESLVEESRMSWEELGNMNMSNERKNDIKKLAEEYLQVWRSVSSDAPRRAEKIRVSFLEKVQEGLQ